MSGYQPRRHQYKEKQDKNKGKFGFEFNQDLIDFRTEIPNIPEKPKHKPDEKIRDKKLKDISQKMEKVKKERKILKQQHKHAIKKYDVEIQKFKQKIELGKKCLKVLSYDLQNIQENENVVSNKIKRRLNNLRNYKQDIKQFSVNKKGGFKKLEQMNNAQLSKEAQKIEYIMMTNSKLTKKEENELNSKLLKISRLKVDSTRKIGEDQINEESSGKIQQINEKMELEKQKLDRLNEIKMEQQEKEKNLNYKIQCISEDLGQCIDEIKQLANQQADNEEASRLYEQSKKLKEIIYKYRQEENKVEEEHNGKVHEFDYEQEKIRWINWAIDVQQKKRDQWDRKKAEMKRNKAKGQPQKNKKQVKGQQKDKKQDAKPADFEPRQRIKINKNQKQIDTCNFLIGYCKQLYPSNKISTENQEKNDRNVNEQLKKGTWSKMKGVEVLTSKKQKNNDQEPVKESKKKSHKNEENKEINTNSFSHSYFVAQAFDSMKILPPIKVEDLDKIILELEDKMEYYIGHPDEGIERKFTENQKKTEGFINPKNYKTRREPKSVIRTEDFPILD